MNSVTKLQQHVSVKYLLILALVIASVLSVNIVLTPPLAEKAGDFTTSPASSTRWGLQAIDATKAWKITKGTEEVVVAVIDSGIDPTIPALNNKMWKNTDEVPGDGIDNDNNGYIDDISGWDFRDDEQLNYSTDNLYYHGTFIAGLLASTYDKSSGAGGVAPNIAIMDLRFLNSAGRFYTSDWHKLANAINYATNNGADIINLSLYATLTPPEYVHKAIKRAAKKGVLVVGIAGNTGNRVSYFGRWDQVFTVGAINKTNNIAPFSNHGPSVDLVAPGVDVLSFQPGGTLTQDRELLLQPLMWRGPLP